jgi:membrane protease subunit HflC
MVGLLIAGFLGLVMLGEFGLGPLLITHEGEQNLILRLREAQAPALGPGLSWRIPLVDDVRTFEARELYLNVEPLPIQTRDKERIVIDNYVLWRIQDPLLFFKSFSTGQGQAELQIDRVVRADVREVIGRRTMSEVVTSERREIMREITEASRKQLEPFGVHVVDVRINLTELPPATEENVYARMRAERERLARKYRAEGKEEARGIRAEAQREARVIVAEANERSEMLKGERGGRRPGSPDLRRRLQHRPRVLRLRSQPRGLPQDHRSGHDPGAPAGPRVLSPVRIHRSSRSSGACAAGAEAPGTCAGQTGGAGSAGGVGMRLQRGTRARPSQPAAAATSNTTQDALAGTTPSKARVEAASRAE